MEIQMPITKAGYKDNMVMRNIRNLRTTLTRLTLVDTVLNKNGLNQARKCGERLQNETYDHVYCSDLTRCKQVKSKIL